MAIDDLWYSSRREVGPDGKLLPAAPTKRHGRGKRWRVRSPGLPSLSFDKKSDAEKADAARRADVSRGLYIDPALGTETVREFGRRFRDVQDYRASTTDLVERAFRLHIDPKLGRLAVAQVRPSTVQSWVKGLDLAPATVRVIYAVLAGMFAMAVRDRVIAASPCTGIRLPPLPHVDHVILTPEQVHALADALPPRYRALVYVGAGCGLRHGEALGLELEHVDFLRREVHVVQQLTVTSGRKPYLAVPKTTTSRRVVELPRVTADALAAHLREFPVQLVEVVDETNSRNVRTRSAQLLFTNSAGTPIHRASWSGVWSPVAREIGLPEKTGYHALRHYFATLLIFAGANVKTVQLALGHSSPTITLDTYVGLWPDQVDRTRTLVDDALGVPEPAVEQEV